MGPRTPEGDTSVFERWRAGDTGRGKVIFINALREPLDAFIDDVADTVSKLSTLSPLTREMLDANKPRGVYISALKSGKLVLYNDLMTSATVELSGGVQIEMEPISIEIV